MTFASPDTKTTGLPGVLGVATGWDVVTFGAPRALVSRLQSECPGVNIDPKPLAGVYSSRPSLFIGGFCFLNSELTRALPAFRRLMAGGAGILWVFWPRSEAWDAEGIRPEMGITAEAVRACAASLGLAESGRAEVDAVWTGMRLTPLSV